ncbi:MAG: hypothetical protein WEB93_02520, partial [Sphingomonadales bacterium]
FGNTALAAALVVTYGFILVYQWYVARLAIGSGLVAAVVVLVDLVLGVAIAHLIGLLLGAPLMVGDGAVT